MGFGITVLESGLFLEKIEVDALVERRRRGSSETGSTKSMSPEWVSVGDEEVPSNNDLSTSSSDTGRFPLRSRILLMVPGVPGVTGAALVVGRNRGLDASPPDLVLPFDEGLTRLELLSGDFGVGDAPVLSCELECLLTSR